jgi:hypothetical protein
LRFAVKRVQNLAEVIAAGKLRGVSLKGWDPEVEYAERGMIPRRRRSRASRCPLVGEAVRLLGGSRQEKWPRHVPTFLAIRRMVF